METPPSYREKELFSNLPVEIASTINPEILELYTIEVENLGSDTLLYYITINNYVNTYIFDKINKSSSSTFNPRG